MNELLSLIGNTPLIRLNEIEKVLNCKSRLYAKLEYMNPFGSIKDRVALQIINDAENNGILKKGGTIIEATSGNLGIALAAISAIKGYRCIIFAPSNIQEKRLALIQAYGAEVMLTDEKEGIGGSITDAIKLSQENPDSFYCNQFSNPSSINTHYNSTACEIAKQMKEEADIIICGVGSGGTFMGLTKYFHGKRTKIYGVLPSTYPHKITGIGAGFIPSIVDNNLLKSNTILIDDETIEKYQRFILNTEGLLIGHSSAATLSALVKISENSALIGKNVVLIFADSGERYI